MKKLLEGFLAMLLAMLASIVMINVVLRYGFQTSILSVDELSRYLFVWLTFTGAIVAFMENRHVSVTFVLEKFSRKIQRRAAIVAHLIILLSCMMVLVGGWQKTLQDWHDHSPILGIPLGLLYAATLPASLAIALIVLHRLLSGHPEDR